jgi:hypothetical protein
MNIKQAFFSRLRTIPFLLIGATFFLSSCTEVIEIPLEETDQQVVVQASLYNLPGLSQVVLTQSGSYYEPGEYLSLRGARVNISDENGNQEVLEEIQPGVYGLPSLAGSIGQQYQLEIEHEGKTFQASSVMAAPVQIDSVSYEWTERNPLQEAGYILQVHFSSDDPETTFLRFRLRVNDTLRNQLFLYDGSLPRGGAGQYRFLTTSLQPGDRVQILTESLDRAAFTYFDQLSELTGDALGPPSAAPANPEGNLSGSALGYFAAIGASVREVEVP